VDPVKERYGGAYLREFREVIENFAPKASRFLEWGSGETTKVLCEIARTRPNPIVLSIDDCDEYQRSVAASLPLYGFLHFRRLDVQGPSLSQEDQYPSYSSYPFFIGMEFDVVFIDGRRRAECALTAAQIVTDEGIVIVHDWRRSRYAVMRALFETLLEGEQFLVLRPKKLERRVRPQSSERRVVIVPARGRRAANELAITLPYTEAYARSSGADCVVVGQCSELPPQRLKCEAIDVAEAYDRTLLLDGDVLIRPGSPDVFAIVPEASLGALPEGVFFPREDWCRTLNEIYGLGEKLTPKDYFNSGVLVLSRNNLVLLKALKERVVWGYPQFEQGFLNAMRAALDLSLFPLTPDFNYMPNGKVFPNDWRYAFFLHYAGSGKDKYNYQELFEDKTGDRNTFSLRRFMSADVRVGLIQQASEQIQGKTVRIFDATDFFYKKEHAQPIFDHDGGIVAFFPARPDSSQRRLAVFGPYVALEPGRWRAQFKRQDGAGFVYDGAALDVVKDSGAKPIIKRRDWPPDGAIEFCLRERAEKVEFRIYRSAPTAEFSYLRLERLDDETP
jgi:hypothetical protein